MSEGHRLRPREHRDQREEHHERRRRSQSPIPSSSRSCHPPRRPRSPPPSRRQSPLIDRHGLQALQPSLPTPATKHLPLALPSESASTPAQAATSETRCTLSDSPVTFPALLYIEGIPLDEDDPNDFLYTAPHIATALKESQIAAATAVTPPSPSPSESTNPTSSARRPRSTGSADNNSRTGRSSPGHSSPADQPPRRRPASCSCSIPSHEQPSSPSTLRRARCSPT
jgi:hypothetical protein